MLEACRAASAIESVVVTPSLPGVVLPGHLSEEALVRLNLVAGRDAPAVLLDGWGIRCNLTFGGSRHDCAIPWQAVLAGVLRPPGRKQARFGVIEGGKKD
jgi:stringent starvation protein B